MLDTFKGESMLYILRNTPNESIPLSRCAVAAQLASCGWLEIVINVLLWGNRKKSL